MSDRIGEDALLDVGCCLTRFEVDFIQCLSWKSHVYLANKSHILPGRLLEIAQIGQFYGESSVFASPGSARVYPGVHAMIFFKGTHQEAFQFVLAAIKDSNIRVLSEFLSRYSSFYTLEVAVLSDLRKLLPERLRKRAGS